LEEKDMRWVLISTPRVVFGILLFMLLSISAHAQFRAGLQGSVTDAQGAAIPGATVTLTNEETNKKQDTKTGAEGYYRFDRLSPGTYTVSAEVTGFKKKLLEKVVISAEQLQGLNIELEAGSVSDTVTISADATQQLVTENANIDRALTTEEILRLPQTGRDPYELARLTPGVFGLGARNATGGSVRLPNSSGPGGSNSSIFQTENQVPISANGQRLSANNFEIDGVAVNSQAWGGAAVLTPNQESVKEVRVSANQYSAENGRNTGALIQVVSQNGTNNYHGSAFFKYNDPSLNAFNKWGGPNNEAAKRIQNRFRQLGGSIGGPVVFPKFGEGGRPIWAGKDKLFFFFSFERLRNRSNNFENKWIETEAFRSGLRAGSLARQIVNLPGMAQRVDAVLQNTCAAAHARLAEPGNCQVVPGGLDIGSPVGGPLGQRLATNNLTGNGLDGVPDIQYVQLLKPSNNTAQQFNGRIDFQASSKDLIAFSFYYTPNNNESSPNGRPIQDFLSARRNTAGSVLWNHTFGPTLLNEARFNATRWYFNEFQSNPNAPWGIPHVRVADVLPEIDWAPGGAGVFYQTTFNFRDVLSKVVGSHGLKFGGEIQKEQNNDTIAWANRPDYFFGSLWNFANDAPLREEGNFDPRTGIPTDVKKYIRASTYSFFVQDDWKVRRNLTLNLGVRWEYWKPLTEKFGNLSVLEFGQGANALSGARLRLGGPLHDPDRNNFGPQLGFAWSPGRFKEKAVLRGGFGIGYNRVPYSITLSGRLNPPFVGAFKLEDPSQILYTLGQGGLNNPGGYPSNPATILQFDPTTNLPINLPSTTGKPNIEFSSNPNVPNPYTYRYSLDLQYELWGGWVSALGYQGSNGRKFPRVVNAALFFDRNADILGNNIRYMPTDVNMNYNALIARLSRRYAKGLDLNVQYRWSKSMDFCSDDQDCRQTFPFDQSTEYGPSDYDVTHSFVGSGLWDLPILRGRSDFIGKAFGGWQLNGIVTASSGFPWTAVYDQGCVNLTGRGNVCPLRPIAYTGGLKQDLSNDAFKRVGGTFGTGAASAFTPPPGGDAVGLPARPGIGRNTFRGPHYFQVDASVIKRIGLPGFFGEKSGLDLRANFFNLFNNLNLKPFEFNTDSTRVNHANFGRATEALSGRVVEFQARFFF
jgi:hypothetical protein